GTKTRARGPEGEEREDPERGDDHGAAEAPATDRVDADQLDVRQIQREREADRRQAREHDTPAALQQRRGSQREQRDDEHHAVAHDAEKRDRQAEQHSPGARLHGLARAGAALQRAAHAEGMEPEIERDEEADEREQRGRLATTPQCCAGARCLGGVCAMMLSAIALKASELARSLYILPLTKNVGVPFTNSLSPCCRLNSIRAAKRPAVMHWS